MHQIKEDVVMRRYELVSGIIFAVMAVVQLIRTLLGWPVQVDLFTVPVWLSGIAFLITGSMAVWAFRSRNAQTPV
jgi:hypothetical protein